jgi:molecular chaperone GrpE
MSEHRQVWATLSELLQRLEQNLESTTPPAPQETNGVEKELRKLGKTQYRANTLAEEQAKRLEKALAELETAQQAQDALVEEVVERRLQEAEQAWLASLLPALDGLDHAIANGQQYLTQRDKATTSTRLTEQQKALLSPADRAKLASWLDGLQIVQERILAVLEAGGVSPIPTVGHPFDPHLHVAVETTTQGATEPGTIVSEERRGYQTENGVLRYADVVVYRPA